MSDSFLGTTAGNISGRQSWMPPMGIGTPTVVFAPSGGSIGQDLLLLVHECEAEVHPAMGTITLSVAASRSATETPGRPRERDRTCAIADNGWSVSSSALPFAARWPWP
jgi:hypothetical protein